MERLPAAPAGAERARSVKAVLGFVTLLTGVEMELAVTLTAAERVVVEFWFDQGCVASLLRERPQRQDPVHMSV